MPTRVDAWRIAPCPCSCKYPWLLFLSASRPLNPSATACSSKSLNPKRRPPAAFFCLTPPKKSPRWVKWFRWAPASATTTAAVRLPKLVWATRSSTASTPAPTSSSAAMSTCCCPRRTSWLSSTEISPAVLRLESQLSLIQPSSSLGTAFHGKAHHLQRERPSRSRKRHRHPLPKPLP